MADLQYDLKERHTIFRACLLTSILTLNVAIWAYLDFNLSQTNFLLFLTPFLYEFLLELGVAIFTFLTSPIPCTCDVISSVHSAQVESPTAVFITAKRKLISKPLKTRGQHKISPWHAVSTGDLGLLYINCQVIFPIVIIWYSHGLCVLVCINISRGNLILITLGRILLHENKINYTLRPYARKLLSTTR